MNTLIMNNSVRTNKLESVSTNSPAANKRPKLQDAASRAANMRAMSLLLALRAQYV